MPPKAPSPVLGKIARVILVRLSLWARAPPAAGWWVGRPPASPLVGEQQGMLRTKGTAPTRDTAPFEAARCLRLAAQPRMGWTQRRVAAFEPPNPLGDEADSPGPRAMERVSSPPEGQGDFLTRSPTVCVLSPARQTAKVATASLLRGLRGCTRFARALHAGLACAGARRGARERRSMKMTDLDRWSPR